MLRLYALLFLFSTYFLGLSGCQDPEVIEEEVRPICEDLTDASLQAITGIRFFDENGSPIGLAGNPNVDNDREFLAYPNPCGPVLNIGLPSPATYRVFIIPATKDTACADSDFSDVTFLYSELALRDAASLEIQDVDSNIQVNMSGQASESYYKIIFVSNEGQLLIENVYYSRDRLLNDVYLELLAAF
jgi:hypothetical protein